MDVSIIIRTYNEARHLPELLGAIEAQRKDGLLHEVLVVDSGSSDATVEFAEKGGCRILHIPKESFSFGRSLNLGCRSASGRYLVFVSGHCVPVNDRWLTSLLRPLIERTVSLVYGRQVGGSESRFSECRIFERHYPATSSVPQEGFFNNNANAALLKDVWEQSGFDEELTGLEDLCLGKKLLSLGMKIGYVSEAEVRHMHDESWGKIRNRFEREALALQHIMPEIHLTRYDFARYLGAGIAHDGTDALRRGCFLQRLPEIFMYRLMQYWGAYRGNHIHRRLSSVRKERYFYPR